MFKAGKLFILCVFAILSILGCVKKDNRKVKINVELFKSEAVRVDLTSTNMLNLDTLLLATTTADSTGNALLEFSLEKPIFASINAGDQYIQLYLSPGDKLEIAPEISATGTRLHFTGDGAAAQTFLENSRDAIMKWEELKGKHISDIKPEEVVARRDSLQNELDYLLQNFAKDESVIESTKQIMASKNRIAMYNYQQRFVDAYGQTNSQNPLIPATLKQAIQELPEDSVALARNMNGYAGLLLNYLHSKIYREVAEQVKGLNRDSLAGKWAGIVDEAIQKGAYAPLLKEYFRAANITYWVADGGLAPELVQLRDVFLSSVKAPFYTKSLARSFGKWEKLAAGKPAPDFTGITADGKVVLLSSLSGKLVYVDVWATWCGPCLAEFPYAHKLLKEFEGNDRVVFLYVSIDEDIDSWKKMLKDTNVPAGLHINQQVGKPGSLWGKYYLSGIPRYLLINTDGTMLEANAPRPSTAKTAALIHKYLKES